MAEIHGTITANNTPIEVSIIGSGPPGRDGAEGAPGFSPIITVEEVAGGHTITITDAEHQSGQSFNVMDGEDGQQGVPGQDGQDGAPGADGQDGADGVSPEVTVETISGGHKVTITDAEHPEGQSFNVMDGEGAGDMTTAIYDADNAVANAGGIAAYLAAHTPELLFYCEYGVTTFAQITAALDGGKLPVCLYGEYFYIYTGVYNENYCFTCVIITNARRLTVTPSSTWANNSFTISQSEHTHSASNITSGAVTIAHGGTGATTAVAAITNLGLSNKIIDSSGTNWVKFADGTAMCWGTLTLDGTSPTTEILYKKVHGTTSEYLVEFPFSFMSVPPTVQMLVQSNEIIDPAFIGRTLRTVNGIRQVVTFRTTASTANIVIGWTATGRWK